MAVPKKDLLGFLDEIRSSHLYGAYRARESRVKAESDYIRNLTLDSQVLAKLSREKSITKYTNMAV